MIDDVVKEYQEYKKKYIGMVMEGDALLMLIDRLDTLNSKLDILIKIQSRRS